MSKYVEYEWIKKVILSCASVSQLLACSKLIFPFRKKYDTKRLSLGQQLRDLQQSQLRIRTMWNKDTKSWAAMLPIVKALANRKNESI